MPNLGSSLLYACCVFCFVAFRINAAYVTYGARRNEYFDIAAVQRVKTRSAIECCVGCEFDDDCSTINYKRENSECELLAERPKLRVDSKLNWTFFMNPGCYEDWVYFKQSCYLLVKNPLNWYQADGYCKTLGAELVDIHSAGEQTFVANYHTSNNVRIIWYGLNDIAEEGVFRWSSGRPTTYTAYMPGEPNGKRSTNCIVTYSGHTRWNDGGCSSFSPFICEKSTT